ncbi:MAG: hypothetical protein DHS20C19_01430 [Acidimicrobiales bacterium]|nr:MAG: hypothetical protein DHS20C19_01430 [Acidimicrobiales bacterium]
MVVVGVVALLGLPGASSAGIGGGSLTVTPSTGLVEGQTILIEGNHGASTSSGVGICRSGSTFTDLIAATSACTTLAALGGPTYSISHAVARTYSMGGVQVDCAAEPCSVFLLGAEVALTVSLVLEVPLELDVSGPLVTIMPNTLLGDRSETTVGFNGGETGVATDVVQCVVLTPLPDLEVAPNRCVDLGPASGAVPDVAATVAVQRWIDDADGVERDCAAVLCVLGVRHGNAAPYSYVAREANFTSSPLVTVTPSLTLAADGDTMSVDATNLDRSYAAKQFFQCIHAGSGIGTGVELGCIDVGAAFDTTPGSTYSSTFIARRFVTADGGTYDCSTGIFVHPVYGYAACAIVLKGFDAPSADSEATQLYATTFVLASVPPLSVTPREDLQLTQTVDVVVDRPSSDPGYAGVCPRQLSGVISIDMATRICDGGPLDPWERGHSFTATVRRSWDTDEFGPIDCAAFLVDVSGGCEFVVLASPPGQPGQAQYQARVRLDFEKSTSIGAGLAVLSGSMVPVEVVGFAGGSGFTAVAAQCGAQLPLSFQTFRCRVAGPVETDFDGDYSGAATVERFIHTPGEPSIDCAHALPTNCGVILFMFDASGEVLAVPGAAFGVFDELPS